MGRLRVPMVFLVVEEAVVKGWTRWDRTKCLLTGCGHLVGTMLLGVGYAASGPESMQDTINRGEVHAQDVGDRLWIVTGLESTDGFLPHGV